MDYTSPQTEVIPLQTEALICESNYGSIGAPGLDLGLDDDDYEFGIF